MAMSLKTVMAIKSYQSQADALVKNYLLADRFVPYTSVLGGMLACKLVCGIFLPHAGYKKETMLPIFNAFLHIGSSSLPYALSNVLFFLLQIYDLTQLVSNFYIKSYLGLTKIQRVEWNNRGMSTIHAIYISIMSLYFVFWSDLFSDQRHAGLVTFQSSTLSTFILGISVGYFLADLGLIVWLYPSLGGMEYVVHHSLSGLAVAYSVFSGEGQLYTYMVLISEITTPEINMRWYLDTAGMKRSCAYLINGIVIFFAWLVARILLFGYTFYHVYLHYDQVIKMHVIGYLLVFGVPTVLGMMNLMWFGKIVKGLMKTISKRR